MSDISNTENLSDAIDAYAQNFICFNKVSNEATGEESSEDKKADSDQQDKANGNAEKEQDSTTASKEDGEETAAPKKNRRSKVTDTI